MLRAQGWFRQDRKQAIFNSLHSVSENIPVQVQFLSVKKSRGREDVSIAYIFLVAIGSESYITWEAGTKQWEPEGVYCGQCCVWTYSHSPACTAEQTSPRLVQAVKIQPAFSLQSLRLEEFSCIAGEEVMLLLKPKIILSDRQHNLYQSQHFTAIR